MGGGVTLELPQRSLFTEDWQELKRLSLGEKELREELEGLAQSQGNPFLLYQAELEPGLDLPTHAHAESRALAVTRGGMKVYAGGHLYELSPGDVLIVPPLPPHRIEADPEQGVAYTVITRR